LHLERAFDTMTTVSRTRVRRRRLTLLVGSALVAAAWAGPIGDAMAGPGLEPVSATTYVVRTGDTLWGIAGRVAPGRDPRTVVDAISRENGVDPGALAPGQTLLIPAIG
jgi:nucleoid-associated protein YgaU